MQQAQDSELVPLKTGFDVAWRGFNRAQVTEHLEAQNEDIRMLNADRDAALSQVDYLTSRLERARTEAEALRAQLDAVCRGPVNGEQLSQRLQRMLELANAEAAEITARAQATAEHIAADAQDAAQRMLAEHRAAKAELERRREELEAEHRELMRTSKAQVEDMTAAAQTRRNELYAEAKRRRASEDEDFRIAQSERRRTLDAQLVQERADAEADAERVRQEAREHAGEIVAEATGRVEELDGLRDTLRSRLGTAMELMQEAAPLIESKPTVPDPTPRPDTQEPEATEKDEVTAVPQQAQPGTQHSPVPPNKRAKSNRRKAASGQRGR